MPSPSQSRFLEMLALERRGEFDPDSSSSQLRQRLFSAPGGVDVDAWAAESGMTRSAAISAIQQLRKYGFELESTDGVYRLLNPDHEPSAGDYAKVVAQSERLRNKIRRALQQGKTVTADSMRCGAQELGSHVRYLRREMDIAKVSNGKDPVAYAVVNDNGARTAAGAPKSASRSRTDRPASIEVVEVVEPTPPSPALPQRYPVPRVDDVLRVQTVSRRDGSTVVVELVDGTGHSLELELAATAT